jgi:predicted phage terminase large subunit-like protein
MLSEALRRLAGQISHDWPSQARENQRLPEGDWLYWLILAGRGFGKTRTVSETVRQWIKDGFNYVNIIGATADDVRTVSVEGPAGILACCPPAERPEYLKRSYELRWPNGATSLLFSAEEPDRLRGKQHMKLACDEIAAWREPDAWDQALLGLRLGRKPQAVIATTPRPTKIIRDLVANPRTHLIRGSTYDNKANLSDAFVSQIIQKYEGTRLGRQELNAEILDDVIGALWSRALLEQTRRTAAPPLSRIVVAIDPSVSAGEGANECGLIVAGLGDDGHGYVLADESGVMAPVEWARKACQLYRTWSADRIVAEANQGGALVESTIRAVEKTVSFKAVHASRGKITRAEPIAALFEQGRAHIVGTSPQLEDQLCTYSAGSSESPDRLDAMVWALTELALTAQRPQLVWGGIELRSDFEVARHYLNTDGYRNN